MAASVEQLSVSIDQVEEHAREARTVTQDSSAQSGEGGRIIHEAAGEIKRIAEAVNGTAGSPSRNWRASPNRSPASSRSSRTSPTRPICWP
jgi:hypothetical protein